ncbi:hypothetical protein FB45DRAFT_999073 [Roridomyces roridus]|uniref:Uncharacterized protein n=1 Tax=Roridomyces roridus TaxID=1738132 RepID=A0AAD7FWS1_9AGAR|nr:hypothetical protein FB45DRAFT_999073 [Roridomyces roridus]
MTDRLPPPTADEMALRNAASVGHNGTFEMGAGGNALSLFLSTVFLMVGSSAFCWGWMYRKGMVVHFEESKTEEMEHILAYTGFDLILKGKMGKGREGQVIEEELAQFSSPILLLFSMMSIQHNIQPTIHSG